MPPKSPPPRFIPSDIKLLNVYLCKPISIVMATCSSLILPPVQIPGLPLDRLETLYLKDPWRIKHEDISSPALPRPVSCWIYGKGWPAKTFIISGWLVGVDRREKFITYHVDDGTAVLECQIHVARLNEAFHTTNSQDSMCLPYEMKPPTKCKDVDMPDLHQNSGGSAAPTKKPKTDPRLDAYRRLPSSERKTSTLKSTTNTELDKTSALATQPVTEETIARYAELKIGVVMRLVGKPKSLFRDTKRVLDLEKVVVIQDHQAAEEEIRFRNHLRFCRSHIYNLPFRLANVWPEALTSSASGRHLAFTLPDRFTARKDQPEEKEPRRLKLPTVSRLSPSQITFSRYLTYVSHYIISRYELPSPIKEEFSYHEMKKKMELSERMKVEDFSIEELVDDRQEDDGYASLRREMTDFTDRLIREATQRKEIEDGKPRGIFLTEADGGDGGGRGGPRRGRHGRTETRTTMVTRALQALVRQGTLILSPDDEARFALPDITTLGPKIIHIINHHQRQFPERSCVHIRYLRSVLHQDLLWKAVPDHTLLAVLRHLQLPESSPDSWRIPSSSLSSHML
ncbi:hypothetical protein VP01_63g6 [Puccinia sorghi]|uniref:CST complex subunit STN1 n=1 Tax=Puccinia sorghi TaxID=27349 RepID=A0A0L6UI02_9BASI|nr:hypothetical protein VP01_63g6 [Puccinia sorghi]